MVDPEIDRTPDQFLGGFILGRAVVPDSDMHPSPTASTSGPLQPICRRSRLVLSLIAFLPIWRAPL
jgi:hypothetical protein